MDANLVAGSELNIRYSLPIVQVFVHCAGQHIRQRGVNSFYACYKWTEMNV